METQRMPFSSSYTAKQHRECPIRAMKLLSIEMQNQQLFVVYLDKLNVDSPVHTGNSLGLCEYWVHQKRKLVPDMQSCNYSNYRLRDKQKMSFSHLYFSIMSHSELLSTLTINNLIVGTGQIKYLTSLPCHESHTPLCFTLCSIIDGPVKIIQSSTWF